MAEIVNLKARRKDAARKAARAQADANAARFGRTKAQKALEQAQAEQSRKRLDAAQRQHDVD
jgi:hypothetical protein